MTSDEIKPPFYNIDYAFAFEERHYMSTNAIEADRFWLKCRFIGVGLCSSSVSLNKLPGWEKNSYGYHGDDGCIFKGSGAGQNYGPTFGNKDTVGCCYNMAEGTVFYTKNGVHQGIAFSNITSQPMYPAIGLRSPGEVVVVNLGTSAPFMFDIDSYVRDCKTAALNTIRQ
ncbi:hypothetical protein SARC_16111, partial [Sphaeroforma arctica JP610]